MFYKKIDADIVLLQEVDFHARRSHFIDQAAHIAKKNNYSYIARALHMKEKWHPSFGNLHGSIKHGICILSRYPLQENLVKIFEFPEEMPFYLRWIFNPHGAQKVTAIIGKNKIKLSMFTWNLVTKIKRRRNSNQL